MTYQIHDKANGTLQFEGAATNETAAWKAFREDMGYSDDIPGVCERDAYVITPKPTDETPNQ